MLYEHKERVSQWFSYGIICTPIILLLWFVAFLVSHLGNTLPESSLTEQLIDVIPGTE
mgnify:CR=1 FL=1